jgi:hypothetical protein
MATVNVFVVLVARTAVAPRTVASDVVILAGT